MLVVNACVQMGCFWLVRITGGHNVLCGTPCRLFLPGEPYSWRGRRQILGITSIRVFTYCMMVPCSYMREQKSAVSTGAEEENKSTKYGERLVWGRKEETEPKQAGEIKRDKVKEGERNRERKRERQRLPTTWLFSPWVCFEKSWNVTLYLWTGGRVFRTSKRPFRQAVKQPKQIYLRQISEGKKRKHTHEHAAKLCVLLK